MSDIPPSPDFREAQNLSAVDKWIELAQKSATYSAFAAGRSMLTIEGLAGRAIDLPSHMLEDEYARETERKGMLDLAL